MSLRTAIADALRRRASSKKAAKPLVPRRVPLKDGIHFDGRIIDHLDFRPAELTDYLPLEAMKPDDLGDALRMISHITGEPFEALNTMTQDDALVVLAAFDRWMHSENARLTKVLEKWQHLIPS